MTELPSVKAAMARLMFGGDNFTAEEYDAYHAQLAKKLPANTPDGEGAEKFIDQLREKGLTVPRDQWARNNIGWPLYHLYVIEQFPEEFEAWLARQK